MTFWLLAAAAAVLVALWTARPLILARRAAAPRAAHDMQVFRDQLSAVDRDLERGVLTEAEAEGARAEISRRLLAADAEARATSAAGPAPRGASLALAAGVAALTVAGGAGLYAVIGAPGMQDMPLAMRQNEIRAVQPRERPGQEEAERLYAARRQLVAQGVLEGAAPAAAPEPTEEEAQLRDIVARLRGVLADRPEDVEGRRMLAGVLLRLGEAGEARLVQQEILGLLGEAATAEDHAAAGESMIVAAGGYVSPEAEAQIATALRKAPAHPIARYYAGVALAQNGQPGMALNIWRGLLAEGPEDAPWIPAIRAQIPGLERAAAAPGAPAGPARPPAPGPSEEEMAAAAEMAPEDRAAMIEGMVAGLEDRLATEGGGPDEWARLLRAYGVLGRPSAATRVWADARRAFADAPEALAFLREAAAAAGADLDVHPNVAPAPEAGDGGGG